jgi:hypothetical protein
MFEDKRKELLIETVFDQLKILLIDLFIIVSAFVAYQFLTKKPSVRFATLQYPFKKCSCYVKQRLFSDLQFN